MGCARKSLILLRDTSFATSGTTLVKTTEKKWSRDFYVRRYGEETAVDLSIVLPQDL